VKLQVQCVDIILGTLLFYAANSINCLILDNKLAQDAQPKCINSAACTKNVQSNVGMQLISALFAVAYQCTCTKRSMLFVTYRRYKVIVMLKQK